MSVGNVLWGNMNVNNWSIGNWGSGNMSFNNVGGNKQDLLFLWVDFQILQILIFWGFYMQDGKGNVIGMQLLLWNVGGNVGGGIMLNCFDMSNSGDMM